MQRLARGQERSLRNWLYKPSASPTERFAAALEQAAAEVEDTYAISVETVVVGDTECDERVAALVAAAREAMVNAARHAGSRRSRCMPRSRPTQFSVFVRDRGAGFDLGGGRGRGMGSAGRSSGACSATAARPRSAAPRATAPRYA